MTRSPVHFAYAGYRSRSRFHAPILCCHISFVHITFVFILHFIITVGMPGSANSSQKKKTTESGKTKNQFFCVLENDDGARILSSVNAKTAMSHIKANAGSLIHFTGSLDAAEALQKNLDHKRIAAISGAFNC
jgi:hypothetical protein